MQDKSLINEKGNFSNKSKVSTAFHEILTPEQVIAYLQIKRATLYDWVYRDKIKYYKLGKLLRFKKSEIDELLVSNSSKD